MNLVVISNEAICGGETNVLNRLFEAGLGCFHLRKCEVSADVLRAFLEEIAPQFHPRIVLHDHYELVREFALKGVHLNKRNLHRAEEYRSWINSVSAHIVEELTMLPEGVKYAFLSPIFHSISKVGYRAAFSDEKLREARLNGIIHHGVYALGGVCEENLEQVAAMGFGGAAVLGDFWQAWNENHDDEELLAKYRRMQDVCNRIRRASIPRIQYISTPLITDVDGLVAASEGMVRVGVPLIQIRNKKMSVEEIAATATRVLAVTRKTNKRLIINDNPYLALQIGADGVHLGKQDMPVGEARALLGENFIVGGTANSFDDVMALHQAGVDYIGLGPFRFTTTKDNLSPVLGLEGYRAVMHQCAQYGVTTPIFAIGGIVEEDIDDLMKTGIYGVAMSGGLHAATMKESELRIGRIKMKIEEYER